MSNSDTEWEVECIMDEKLDDEGDVWYKVKWTGFPEEESTWLLPDDLNCPDILSDWLKKLPKRAEAAARPATKPSRKSTNSKSRSQAETCPAVKLSRKCPATKSSRKSTNSRSRAEAETCPATKLSRKSTNSESHHSEDSVNSAAPTAAVQKPVTSVPDPTISNSLQTCPSEPHDVRSDSIDVNAMILAITNTPKCGRTRAGSLPNVPAESTFLLDALERERAFRVEVEAKLKRTQRRLEKARQELAMIKYDQKLTGMRSRATKDIHSISTDDDSSELSSLEEQL